MNEKLVMKIAVTILIAVLIIISVSLLLHRPLPSSREIRFALGTMCELEVVGVDDLRARELIDRGFEEIDRYEAQLSIYDEDSEVNRVNKFASMMPVPVSRSTFDVIQASLYYAKLSKGLFDITVLPLVATWGFSTKQFAKPSAEQIAEARTRIGWEKVVTSDEGGGTMVQFMGTEMQIDLGGIAKGYICDRVSDLFLAEGAENFLVNIGGTIFAHGVSRRNHHWVAGIRNPRDKARIIDQVTLFNEAIATSGDYERYFIEDNKRYAHIINPVTGYPVEGMVAVTVVASTAIEADAASTIMFLTKPAEQQAMFDALNLKKAIIFDENLIGTIQRTDID